MDFSCPAVADFLRNSCIRISTEADRAWKQPGRSLGGGSGERQVSSAIAAPPEEGEGAAPICQARWGTQSELHPTFYPSGSSPATRWMCKALFPMQNLLAGLTGRRFSNWARFDRWREQQPRGLVGSRSNPV